MYSVVCSLTMVSVIYLRVTVTAGGCGGSAAKLEGGDMTDEKKKKKKMIREKPRTKRASVCFH